MEVRCWLLTEAAKDYKYLLNRGYPQRAILNIVVSRYGLTAAERNALLRCVHRTSDVLLVIARLARPTEVVGAHVVIDGYNTLLTILTALEGGPLFLCDDCVIRDVRSSYTKRISMKSLVNSLNVLASALTILRPVSVTIVLDKNVSHSAEHAVMIERALQARAINARVELRRKADTGVLSHSADIVCSSDYLIVTRARKVFDLAGYAVTKVVGAEIATCLASGIVDKGFCGGPAGI